MLGVGDKSSGASVGGVASVLEILRDSNGVVCGSGSFSVVDCVVDVVVVVVVAVVVVVVVVVVVETISIGI